MTPQFNNQVSTDNNGPCLTVSGLHRVNVVPVRSNGIRQPLICALVVKSKQCPTLSSVKVKWQLVSTTLCWWWSCGLADQVRLLMHTQEEEAASGDWRPPSDICLPHTAFKGIKLHYQTAFNCCVTVTAYSHQSVLSSATVQGPSCYVSILHHWLLMTSIVQCCYVQCP